MKSLFNHNWFTISEISQYLYVIRERLDKLDSRFHTKWTNLYLILGKESALLFDTGSGIYPLKELVGKIIQDRKLIIVNSHLHFDHICGNSEFSTVHIHQEDRISIGEFVDLLFLKTSTSLMHKKFAPSYKIPINSELISIEDGHIFDLGELEVKVHHVPGHSQGSIVLSTSNQLLFTGDTLHYGSIYLPEKNHFDQYLTSLRKLSELVNLENTKFLYPGHEDVQINISTITNLLKILTELNFNSSPKQYDAFLEAYILDKSPFKLIIPKGYYS